MVEPVSLAVIAGSQLASGALQWLNSEKGRTASEAERARMIGLVQKLREPDFDFSDFTPEDYQVVKTYIPQQTQFVEEIAPQLIKGESADALAGRSAEREALQGLLQRATSGEDPLFNIQLQKGLGQATAAGASARASQDALAQRRGIGLDSPMAYAMGQQGASDAMGILANAGLEAAQQAELRRQQALGQSADLGGRIRQSEINQEAQNADIINKFNQRLADRRQDFNNQLANQANQAQQFNIGQAQNIANINTQGRNQAALGNLERGNTLKQQQFANASNKTGLLTGQGQGAINDLTNFTQQRNTAIQGLGDVVSKSGLTWNQMQADDKRYDLEKQKLDLEKKKAGMM